METISDILKEMRKRCIDEKHSPELWGCFDRIEAAHNREMADALDTGAFVEAARKRKSESVTNRNLLNEVLNEANGIAEWVPIDYIEKKARRICDLCKQIDLQDTCKQSLQGNGVKIREALEEIESELKSYCYEENKTLDDRFFNDPPDYTCFRDSLLKINRLVNSALAAPPRNCDVYDLTKAKAEYEKYRTKICLRESNPFIAQDETLPFDDWLLAEAKGGVK